MNKRLMSGILAAALVLALSACGGSKAPGADAPTAPAKPSSASAANVPVHDLSTAAEDGFEIEAGILKGYHGPNSEVVIPDGVTEIYYDMMGDGGAFEGYTGITSVFIPGSVKTIGHKAFDGCTNLTAVTISEGVTEIGQDAFGGCSSLTEIIIPSTVTTLRTRTFNGCTSLTEVTIPSTITTLEDIVFNQCSSLAMVTITENTKINGNPFAGTPWLDSLGDFPIVNGALLGYNGMGGDIVVPDNVNRIQNGAFSIPQTLLDYPDKYSTALSKSPTSVVIPEGVEEIGYYVFSGCANLVSVDIYNSEAKFGKDVFAGCDNLTIYGKAGSTAQAYAQENNIPFVAQ